MKLQYLLPKDTELNSIYLGKAINDFKTKELPKLNRCWNYYIGKQLITKKKPTDASKPCNKVVVNYCYNIVNNYLGYLAGIPISYDNDNFEEILDILHYNDVANEDNEYLRNALIYGRAFEVNYIDEEGQQRFRLFDTRECLPIYDNTLSNNLTHVVRFYREDLLDKYNENYIVEVYGPQTVRTYRSTSGFTSFELIDEIQHFYSQCPVTVFSLNNDEDSIYNQVMSLQDAYNELLSASVDDYDAFADAYLVLKGAIADSNELEAMKKNRILMIDPDADANYLTKDVTSTQIQFLLDTTDEQIHTIANSPNFNDEKFMAQSGEAIKYKLVGFENASSNIETQMRKALQKRIELITEINKLIDNEEKWRDVKIRFTRNLPNSLTPNTPSDLMTYKGLVSDDTLLTLVPFVNDVEQEKKLIADQNAANTELYFNNNEQQDTE